MTDLAHTRGWVRDLVRSGLMSAQQQYDEVRAAIAEDHPDLPADETARAWIAEAEADWASDASAWPDRTDFDLLQRALTQVQARGLMVLQGCPDHWSAKAALEHAPECRGIVWFTPPDVWHAIDEAMLEVNLWHPTTANAAPGDALLDEVLEVFAVQGLPARFDEGRIEVTARWQRRPGE
ncbi:DUF6891 domain-containing protein [Nocardioides terrisoli]|uniref:DUF6891 domain-containing protein n=1 Tax=Nocardioides terrisoli TaxID=3388267 RepID=UPI00287BC3DD|nr:hypothetical protein [Nocardioides marmorisolisilvae]